MNIQNEAAKIDLSGEVVPIWDMSNFLLDCERFVFDDAVEHLRFLHSELGIQKDGPSIVLTEEARSLIQQVLDLDEKEN